MGTDALFCHFVFILQSDVSGYELDPSKQV